MTALQDTPFHYVESPLTQPFDDFDHGWAETHARQHDPMVAVQQRMMLILSVAVLFVLAFGTWAVRTSNLDS